MDIKYFNRHTEKIEREKVYGDWAVKWLYTRPSGKVFARFLTGKWFSKFYGMLQSAPWSRQKIAKFIQKFDIKMQEFLPDEGRTERSPYKNFNQFFIRAFRPGARSFIMDENKMPAFSEARYFAYEALTDEITLPVKGAYLRAKDLLASEKWGEVFKSGPCFIARLCPVDYHCFHYPDDGELLEMYEGKGLLHSVNPIALKAKEDIFITNQRRINILKTKNFGLLAYIEVGATCVGKIVQTHGEKTFKRGDKKGHFLFGGSTVILIGEAGRWRPNSLFLDYSSQGIEVYTQLGHSIAASSGK